jgi:hypothetical protein
VKSPQAGIVALGDIADGFFEFSRRAGSDAHAALNALVSVHEPRTTVGGANRVIGFRPTSTDYLEILGSASAVERDRVRGAIAARDWRRDSVTASNHSCRTVQTGTSAAAKTASATLPRTKCANPARPCVPITIASASIDEATDTIP